MISSLKKIALDQKVSKLLHAQTNEQTVRSDERFIKTKNQPQTTKYINHKCQIKKNLFHQQKQNIPQGLFTIQFPGTVDQKQKTIKFVTEKSLNEKKENFQYLFNSLDEQDQSQTVKIILKQKQEITELKEAIKDLQTKQKENNLQWQKQKEKWLKELEELREENSMMKYQINKVTSRIEEKSKCQNFQELIDFVKQSQNCSDYKFKEFDETEEDTVISRMLQKVERLSKELQCFIDLSHKFKNQAQEAKQSLCNKILQLETAQKDVVQVQETLKSMQEKFNDQVKAHQKREDLLKSQINAYKDQYEVLRRRHFIMQSEFRKYSSDQQAREEQSLKDKHEALTKKYNLLYQSYKALYEDYVNRSRETDFVMELADSDYKEIRAIGERINLEGSKFTKIQSRDLGTKVMVHLAQESLCECSEIRAPIENVDQHRPLLCAYPKIFLKDLIKETLMECKKSNYQI